MDHMLQFAGLFLLVFALALFPSRQASAQSDATPLRLQAGEWQVTLDPADGAVQCVHASGAVVEGVLTFAVEQDGKAVPWTIVAPRDSVADRAGIADADNNVQGYVAVRGSGGRLEIAPVHRTAQSYRGTLTFTGTARVGADTFACRTRPQAEYRVVQMAAGPADSALNDSLFDVPTDTALRFDGASVVIARPADAFELTLTADIHDAACNALVFDLCRDYYRARYVPYYTPVDKTRCPSPPTGWMSWNTYFDKAGEKDNLDEARIGAQCLKPFGMEIWSIESWQDNSPTLPVSKFHNLTLRPDPNKFPSGMKWLADQIRALGFTPGIWTVPFGTGDAAFYEAHKDWFLHNADGSPMRNWNGLYVVDPSQAAVRQHMEDTHRTMAQDWGYEYFKIDGMSGRNSGYSAHFYERPEVRAAFREPCDDPFKLCVEALRRGIGPDRIWLACQGHFTGAEIGHADAGRTGADIVHPNQPPHWDNYRNQAWCTLNQMFVNNIVWYCDPDTLLVGEAPMETARLATAVVGLPGQMMFAGDKLATLPPERMRLLQQCLPVCDVRPLDLYPIFEMAPIWDLKVRRDFATWDVVSVFNWDEAAADMAVAFAELGLGDGEYVVYDFWNNACLGVHEGGFTVSVAPHGNALLAVHPAAGRPQFISTDRHITQGAISIGGVAWDADAKTLSGTAKLVAGFPSRLALYVPEGWNVLSSEADGAEVVENGLGDDGVYHMTLQSASGGEAAWRVVCGSAN